MSTVVQPWLSGMPWKMQSILFSGLRGPDQEYLVNVKQVSRWMRSVTQHNADPSKPYMASTEMPRLSALYKELEHCTCHFVHHFLDALAVIAYGHPDQLVARTAATFYYSCAEELFHFVPESAHVFWLRHRDKIDGADFRSVEWGEHAKQASADFMDGVMRRFYGKLRRLSVGETVATRGGYSATIVLVRPGGYTASIGADTTVAVANDGRVHAGQDNAFDLLIPVLSSPEAQAMENAVCALEGGLSTKQSKKEK